MNLGGFGRKWIPGTELVLVGNNVESFLFSSLSFDRMTPVSKSHSARLASSRVEHWPSMLLHFPQNLLAMWT